MTRPATVIGGVAVCVAATAVVFAATGVGVSAPAATSTPQEGRPLRLGPGARFPAEVVPTVARAQVAQRIGSTTLSRALLECPSDTAARRRARFPRAAPANYPRNPLRRSLEPMPPRNPAQSSPKPRIAP